MIGTKTHLDKSHPAHTKHLTHSFLVPPTRFCFLLYLFFASTCTTWSQRFHSHLNSRHASEGRGTTGTGFMRFCFNFRVCLVVTFTFSSIILAKFGVIEGSKMWYVTLLTSSDPFLPQKENFFLKLLSISSVVWWIEELTVVLGELRKW